MCGLIGFIGVGNPNPLAIKLLYAINQDRGTDSCGIFVRDHGIVKVAGKAIFKFLPHLQIPLNNIVLGHVRQGTAGSKIKENSHPFRAGSIVQTHNGTLTNWAEFSRKDGTYQTTHVDSEAMVKHFNILKTEDGVENYIAEGLQDITGAMACMWYDYDRPNQIQFFRNTERPLFYGGINENEAYFSSYEEGLLSIGVPQERVVDVKPFVIYTAIVENGVLTINEEVWEKRKPTFEAQSNFQTAPQKGQQVVLFPITTQTNLMELKNNYQNVLNPKEEKKDEDKSKSPYKSGDKVEFLDKDCLFKSGKVLWEAIGTPNHTYFIERDKPEEQKFAIVHHSLINYIESETFERGDVVKNLNTNSVGIVDQVYPHPKKLDYIVERRKNIEDMPTKSKIYLDYSCFEKLENPYKVGDKVYCYHEDNKVLAKITSMSSGSNITVTFIDNNNKTRNFVTNQILLQKVLEPEYKEGDFVTYYDDIDATVKNGTILRKTDDGYAISSVEDKRTSVTYIPKTNIKGIVNTTSTKEVETINDDEEEEWNYDNYDSALELYDALQKNPSFYDENGIFESLNSMDIILSDHQSTLKGGLTSDDDVKSFVDGTYELRMQILELMISISKAMEIDNE